MLLVLDGKSCRIGCGRGIRTPGLLVMSQARYRTAPSRVNFVLVPGAFALSGQTAPAFPGAACAAAVAIETGKALHVDNLPKDRTENPFSCVE